MVKMAPRPRLKLAPETTRQLLDFIVELIAHDDVQKAVHHTLIDMTPNYLILRERITKFLEAWKKIDTEKMCADIYKFYALGVAIDSTVFVQAGSELEFLATVARQVPLEKLNKLALKQGWVPPERLFNLLREAQQYF